MAGPSTPRLQELEALELTPTPRAEAFEEVELDADFILGRVDMGAADRRLSKELGGEARLSETFDRVKTEHAESDIDWMFWGAVVQDYEAVARTQPTELASAIQKGIPDVIRGSIWQLMSSSKSPPLETIYKDLLRQTSSHEKAIRKDITRTFPSHPYFQEAVGQDGLYMVLKAYSLHDEEVGYCQGVAFIVATLLLKMPDEEAFCVLDRLMQSYNLRSHFQPDLAGLSLRLYQFDRLLEDLLPVLYTHFLRQGCKSSMFASQWFMTLFSYRFPLPLVYRIFDTVFAEGIEAIFRFGIALLAKLEDALIAMPFEEILAHLQTDFFRCYDTPDNLVRDAYNVKITPLMLDAYASEYKTQREAANKHEIELDALRNANRNLSSQLKQVQASLAQINQEHVDLVKQLVESRLAREETEAELVRYKLMYAELAHADEVSLHMRRSVQ